MSCMHLYVFDMFHILLSGDSLRDLWNAYMNIYIYIYREREREREKRKKKVNANFTHHLFLSLFKSFVLKCTVPLSLPQMR